MKKIFPNIQKADSSIQFHQNKNEKTGLRLATVVILVISLFLILILRLFQLTIVKGSYYYTLSEDNRLLKLSIPAERGTIFDRRGLVLAKSIPEKYVDYPFIPEKQIVLKWIREYPYKSFFSHSIGYLRIVSDKDLSTNLCENPILRTDSVGSLGLEDIYECHLRGLSNTLLIEKNTQGIPIKALAYDPSIKGKDLYTSLDVSLQEKAYQIFPKNKKGAIIMTKPNTGEILVYASFPSYDPNVFINPNTDIINSLFNEEDKPVFDRVSQGVYPPGSVFKLPVLAGALQDKTISSDFKVEDTGEIQAGPIKFGNWYFLQYGKTDGMVDPIKALQRSNDIFFYKIGGKMGPEKIKSWAEKFGYGTNIQFPLPHNEGLMPNEFWKKENLGENWYLGDTYNMSIGQGYILTTPIQVHHSTSIIANNGYDCPMTFERKQAGYKPKCTNINLKEDVLKILHEGMKKACETGGTAWPFFDFKIFNSSESAKLGYKPESIKVSCKTGTAESHLPSGKPHAWFTVYAPSDKPEIAVTVLVEESGEGSEVASPIAKELVKSYFERVE